MKTMQLIFTHVTFFIEVEREGHVFYVELVGIPYLPEDLVSHSYGVQAAWKNSLSVGRGGDCPFIVVFRI